jgi:hypothetical protein
MGGRRPDACPLGCMARPSSASFAQTEHVCTRVCVRACVCVHACVRGCVRKTSHAQRREQPRPPRSPSPYAPVCMVAVVTR